MLMAELTVRTENGTHTYEMREGRPLFAGRTVECDISLPSPAVSRRHAVFLARNGHCGLKDLGSSNGTYLNGQRITKSMRLKDGDVIQIASFVIEFRIPDAPQYGDADQTVIMSPTGRLAQAGAPQFTAPAAAESESEKDKMMESGLEEAARSARFHVPAAAADVEPPPEAVSRAPSARSTEKKISVRLKPPPDVVLPERREIGDDEVGDGKDDAVFAMEDEQPAADDSDREMALSKAAAEAGLVGEFTPEEEEETNGTGENEAAEPAAGIAAGANISGVAPALSGEAAGTAEPNPDAIPIDENFRHAIETRLFLYSFLADMKREREEFLARRPKMADPVKAELARQDRELDKIPTPEQAENMIEKRRAKQKDLAEKIQQARAKNEPPPPKPSREMREAEEMAISQWTFCAQSAREALPAAYKEGYRVMRSEPLAQMLEAVGVNPVTLMGGAAYYLALEVLLEETKNARQLVRSKLAAAAAEDTKKNGRSRGVFGLFGRGAAADDEAEAEEETPPGETPEELEAEEQQLAARTAWITQETAFMEKTLIAEFWRIYIDVALLFLPRHEDMPWPVRAFLRHGAIGFSRWWMKEDVRDHIIHDCTKDVVHHLQISKSVTNIVYADEYLAAVMNWECTPAMDENLEINERNSPNWKADKALRKLINARSQITLLDELLGTLQSRIDAQQAEIDACDQQLSKLLQGSKDFKRVKSELSQKRQGHKVEATKLTNLANKMRNETMASLRETVTETEDRFASGELPQPTTEFMIRRECEAVHRIGRLLANLKERFQPLVLRDNFVIGTDAVNDRPAILGEFNEMERRDPALFLENIVPSKKKASRVDLRISPVIVLIPSAGVLAFSWNPRQKPEDGRLGIPTCFIRRRIRERQLIYLLADFRWDTSKAAAGMDVMTSDTIVAAFMTVRWDWRKRSKEGREKGLIYSEQNDRTNWRRVYEAYSQSAFDSGKKLYNRNYDFYERIIGKYFDLPEGVILLKK